MGTRSGRRTARGLALWCALAAGSLAAPAVAQTLGPRPDQLDALVAGDRDEPIALARFLRRDEAGAFARYLSELELDVRRRGGARIYGGEIDPALAGPLRYDALVIDAFPSRRACVESLRALDPVVVSLGLEDAYVLALRPWGRGTRLAAGALEWLFGTLLVRQIGEPPSLSEMPQEVWGNAAISPDRDLLRAFSHADPSAGVVMLNLNEFRARASYPPDSGEDPAQTGESAYWRYARVAVPQAMRRGARVLFEGEVIGTVIGAAGDPLDRAWRQLVLVYYPARRALDSLVADPDYRAAARHRVAGLERATLLASVPWPEFDPKAR